VTNRRKDVTATLIQNKEITARVRELSLKPLEPFAFLPAQYIKFKVEVSKKMKSADYTIISPSSNPEILKIAIDNHPKSKIGKIAHQLEVGTEVMIRGPYGRFQFDKEAPAIVSISRDIGIVTLLGNLEYLSQIGYDKPIMVVNFVSKKFEPIYTHKNKSYNSLNISYLEISQQEIGKKAMKTGKLTDDQLESFFGNHLHAHFYLAGKSKFIKKLRKRLTKMGVPRKQMKKELF